MLNITIGYKIEEIELQDSEEKKMYRGSIFINSNKLITAFKTIIRECDVEYKDMLNYTLSIVENKCVNIIKGHSKTSSEFQSEKQIINAFLELQNFIFFIYSVSPKVNTTIRLCRILSIILEFTSSRKISNENRNLIKKNVYDEVCFVLKKNKSSTYTQVETLYLLTILRELGKEYWLEQDVLASYVGIHRDENNNYISDYDLNYFSVTVILFYMQEKVRYNELRAFVERKILQMFESRKGNFRADAELTLLFFDTISCPYISDKLKKDILDLYAVTDANDKNSILDFRDASGAKQIWFTTWKNFNFEKELDAKQSQEVY